MMRSIMRIGAVVLLAALAAAPAAADDEQDKITCEKGSGDEAIDACTRRIAVHTKSRAANAAYNLAVVYYSRGWLYYEEKRDYKRALADYDRAWGTKAGYARALYGRGLAKMQLGDKKGGRKDVDEAFRLDPSLRQ